MKKFTKIAMAIILTLAMTITIIPAGRVDAKSKNIYFAGEYQKKLGGGEYMVLTVNQYSSPEGKTVGNYELMSCNLPSFTNIYVWKNGEIKRTGTNKYKSGKMNIRVYKKKIVITKGGKYNGTYTLKKRFVS